MRGGVLPPAILFAALAFALAFAPRRVLLPALGLAVAFAVAIALVSVPKTWTEAIFAGCWISVALTAVLVHLPRGIPTPVALVAAANAGLWAGATVGVTGTIGDLAKAVPVLLIALPATWLTAHRGGIAVKVAASWLIAVAILGGTLPIVPTPGYAADHMQ